MAVFVYLAVIICFKFLFVHRSSPTVTFFNTSLTLSYAGGGGKILPLLFFLHHPKTAQGIKLKLSDFKDTPLRHFASQTSSLNLELLPWQQNYRMYLYPGML